jgi:hypothetical protein
MTSDDASEQGGWRSVPRGVVESAQRPSRRAPGTRARRSASTRRLDGTWRWRSTASRRPTAPPSHGALGQAPIQAAASAFAWRRAGAPRVAGLFRRLSETRGHASPSGGVARAQLDGSLRRRAYVSYVIEGLTCTDYALIRQTARERHDDEPDHQGVARHGAHRTGISTHSSRAARPRHARASARPRRPRARRSRRCSGTWCRCRSA